MKFLFLMMALFSAPAFAAPVCQTENIGGVSQMTRPDGVALVAEGSNALTHCVVLSGVFEADVSEGGGGGDT